MEITKTRLNYLLAIKILASANPSLTSVSEYLNIKKPTASVALKSLECEGYIERHGGEYALTDAGQSILDGLNRERYEFMSLFCVRLGIDYAECDAEYRRLSGLFSDGFIDALAASRESNYACRDEAAARIRCGRYKLPFRVVGVGSMPSMGDKGFMHPAELFADENGMFILLKSKMIYYKAKSSRVFHGELSQMSYMDAEGQWISVDKTDGSVWKIPTDALKTQSDELSRPMSGSVKIKVRATTCNMPESVAEINFNFEMLEKITDGDA